MKRFALLLGILLLSILGGCAAPAVLIHPQQEYVNVGPAPGMAMVVIIRERMFKGAIAGWSVSLDGRELSRLSVGNYVMKEIQPGKHSLSNVETPTLFSAESGKIYYFKYDLSFFGGNSFEQMSEAEAHERMKKYTRVRVLF